MAREILQVFYQRWDAKKRTSTRLAPVNVISRFERFVEDLFGQHVEDRCTLDAFDRRDHERSRCDAALANGPRESRDASRFKSHECVR
jgi:hypothetical protein